MQNTTKRRPENERWREARPEFWFRRTPVPCSACRCAEKVSEVPPHMTAQGHNAATAPMSMTAMQFGRNSNSEIADIARKMANAPKSGAFARSLSKATNSTRHVSLINTAFLECTPAGKGHTAFRLLAHFSCAA